MTAAKPILHLDWETYSACDLKAHGLSVYSKHPTTDIWLGCYAFDDEPVQTWFPGQTVPERVHGHIFSGGQVWAHNAPFEVALNNTVGRRYGWPPMSWEQMTCTMAMAYAMSIPANLEGAAMAMGLKYQKDMEGHRLMIQMSKPKGQNEDGSYVWWDELEKLERLEAYCKQDIEAERELGNKLLRLSDFEKKVWVVDQRINERGFHVDMPAVKAGVEVMKTEKLRLMEEMQVHTNHAVGSCTAVAQVKAYLEGPNCNLKVGESLNKEALARLLDTPDLTPHAKRVLELRRDGSKTSVSKLTAIANRADIDNRIRNGFQYWGSHTGRWAGRGVQLQNLPRGRYSEADTKEIFSFLMCEAGNAVDSIQVYYGSPMQVLSDVTRSFFTAPEEMSFVWGDWNAIEARVLGWLAGEEPLLELFRKGLCPYEAAYRKAFGVLTVTKAQRQIGKVMILAFGYQGGVGAFQVMAKGYGVKVTDAFADDLKIGYRNGHPNIVRYWYAVEETAIKAVKNPGKAFKVGPTGRQLTFGVNGSFLFCRLPSGRLITYPYPQVNWEKFEWKGEIKEKEQLSYMGEDSETHVFGRKKLYGGLIVENCTQGVARDVMAETLVRLDDHSFPIVAHVHDEVICEVAGKNNTPETRAWLKAQMEVVPKWAAGLPLKAEIDFGNRYRK